jgi:hypothetical protein
VRAGCSRSVTRFTAIQPGGFLNEDPGSTGNSRDGRNGAEADVAAFFAERHALNFAHGFVRLVPQVKPAIIKMITEAAGRLDEA